MQQQDYHRVLKRQIRKYLGRNAVISEEHEALLKAVSESYEHHDKDRYMLERSVDLSSHELLNRNQELLKQKQEIESTLEELRATQAQLKESEKMAKLSAALKLANESMLEQQEELSVAFEDLQSTQAQLVQSEKMSSLGQLTAGVAHEINNPVNFIYGGIQALRLSIEDMLIIFKGFSELMDKLNQYDTHEKLLEAVNILFTSLEGIDDLEEDISVMIQDIMAGAERTAAIVKSLRNFSHTDEISSQMADIHEGIDSTLLILNSQLAKVKLHKEYDNNISQIECYPSSLNQVFMNIISNGLQAMRKAGSMSIVTKDLGEQISITITDSGPGIPEALKSQIFNPFFTTKEIGEGTGLGLSISYGIIEKHGGGIVIESEEGKGASFIVTIPKIQKDVNMIQE